MLIFNEYCLLLNIICSCVERFIDRFVFSDKDGIGENCFRIIIKLLLYENIVDCEE